MSPTDTRAQAHGLNAQVDGTGERGCANTQGGAVEGADGGAGAAAGAAKEAPSRGGPRTSRRTNRPKAPVASRHLPPPGKLRRDQQGDPRPHTGVHAVRQARARQAASTGLQPRRPGVAQKRAACLGSTGVRPSTTQAAVSVLEDPARPAATQWEQKMEEREDQHSRPGGGVPRQ